jgi:hypothetical protein
MSWPEKVPHAVQLALDQDQLLALGGDLLVQADDLLFALGDLLHEARALAGPRLPPGLEQLALAVQQGRHNRV